MADPASDIASSRQTIVEQQKSKEKDALLDVRRKLEAISAEHKAFGKVVTQGLDVVRRSLDDFGASPGGGSLAISFNGGKDACVVLYLLLLVLAERDELDRLSATPGEKRIPVVYFEKEEFPEIEDFMREVSGTYGFEFLRYSVSYKDGMQDLVDNHGVKGVIMGQRRGDPWTETMEWFTPSTPGWAEFTRINPALEWKFCNVWRFLRGSGLPYCVLYDQGYTSLGERGDTAKNEALRLPNGDYRPAYQLAEEEEHLERHPRSPSSVGSGAGQRADASREGGTGKEGNEGCAAEVPDPGAFFPDLVAKTDVVPGAGGGAGGVPIHLGGCEISMEAGSELLEPKGRVVSTSWVGICARWMSVTVALALVLAAVGGRRSDSPRGGGENVVGGGE